jgi:hypothetical protein
MILEYCRVTLLTRTRGELKALFLIQSYQDAGTVFDGVSCVVSEKAAAAGTAFGGRLEIRQKSAHALRAS